MNINLSYRFLELVKESVFGNADLPAVQSKIRSVTLLLFSVFFPNAGVLLFGVIPMRASTLVLLYFCIEFFGSIFSTGSVAHATHLFGLLFALLYVMIRMRIKPWKAWGL